LRARHFSSIEGKHQQKQWKALAKTKGNFSKSRGKHQYKQSRSVKNMLKSRNYLDAIEVMFYICSVLFR
jgi:hypothetical protein